MGEHRSNLEADRFELRVFDLQELRRTGNLGLQRSDLEANATCTLRTDGTQTSGTEGTHCDVVHGLHLLQVLNHEGVATTARPYLYYFQVAQEVVGDLGIRQRTEKGSGQDQIGI